MDVITLGNELLRDKARAVAAIDDDCKKLVEAMLETLERERGVGLAAPQVGRPERLFVVRLKNAAPLVFINPSIVETSLELVLCEEGCLSLPGVWAEVKRPEAVTVQAWNERGRPFTLRADGLLARVILHEYDHLEGVLFIDRLSAGRRERLLSKYDKLRGKKGRAGENPAGGER